MVPALVLLTIVALLLVDAVLRRRAERAREGAVPTPFDAATELYYHPGHAWARPTPDGLVTVGVTDFASQFAGELQRVKLPQPGRRFAAGERAWSLISKRGRRLDQLAPLSGKVVAVNERLRDDPGLVQGAPFGEGWLLRLRPRRARTELNGLLRGSVALAWRDAVRAAVVGRTPLGAVAQDGGEWCARFGDRLDDDAWQRARRELFPSEASLEDEAGS
jgi:glycine cleavage system H protein